MRLGSSNEGGTSSRNPASLSEFPAAVTKRVSGAAFIASMIACVQIEKSSSASCFRSSPVGSPLLRANHSSNSCGSSPQLRLVAPAQVHYSHFVFGAELAHPFEICRHLMGPIGTWRKMQFAAQTVVEPKNDQSRCRISFDRDAGNVRAMSHIAKERESLKHGIHVVFRHCGKAFFERFGYRSFNTGAQI